jgi:hypothetical protein
MDRAWCSTSDAVGLLWLSEDRWDVERARTACRDRCPVREACLAWVLAVEAGAGIAGRGGVWGAMSPEERELAWRERRRAGRRADEGDER